MYDPPTARTLLTRWCAAWNAADVATLTALLGERGVYRDPLTLSPVGRSELSTHLRRWHTAIADLTWEISSVLVGQLADDSNGGSAAMATLTLRGINRGELVAGCAPLARTLQLAATLLAEVHEDGARMQLAFDRHALWEQVGLQVLVEPYEQGNASYGYSMRVASGNRAVPGLIALTWIGARDDTERDHIRSHSREIVRNFLAEPGFIGIVTGFQGGRGFTVTAWEDEDALHRGLAQQHRTAMRELRKTDLAPGVWTSVWQPLRINRIWTRCVACAALEDVTDDHRQCTQCGTLLGERPPFW